MRLFHVWISRSYKFQISGKKSCTPFPCTCHWVIRTIPFPNAVRINETLRHGFFTGVNFYSARVANSWWNQVILTARKARARIDWRAGRLVDGGVVIFVVVDDADDVLPPIDVIGIRRRAQLSGYAHGFGRREHLERKKKKF